MSKSQRLSPTKSPRQSSWNSPTRQPLTQSQPERKSPWKIKFTHESRISRPTTKRFASDRGLLHASATRSQRSGALTTASSPRSQTSKATTSQADSSFLKNSRTPSSLCVNNSESSEITLVLCRCHPTSSACHDDPQICLHRSLAKQVLQANQTKHSTRSISSQRSRWS